MATVSVRSGPMAMLDRQLDILSPRDRRLLVGLVLSLAFVFAGGFWYLLSGALDTKASRVREAKETYAAVQALEASFRQADAQFNAQKDRLQNNEPVTAWVEDLATRHGIISSLSTVRQNATEEVGDIVQTRYTVELKKAPQESVYRFLYELETGGYPARVDQATFKVVTVKKERQLDMTLDLVVLSLAEG